MYRIELGKSGLQVPAVAVGCMRITSMSEKELAAFIDTAMENGANFFDHADIYGKKSCEALFGKVITPSLREKMILQTKCGIVPGKMYDYSYDHIVESANNSLRNFGTDHIDVLLLHRPDTLMEPEEVAKAFADLKKSGKVRHFGVSNQNPGQMQLLQRYLDMPLCVNQLQFGLMHTPMIQSGINVNMSHDPAINRDGGVLEYCRLNDITIQAWSPMRAGEFRFCFVDHPAFPELNKAMAELGEKYGVSKTAIAIAWILRHPARIQPVTGTTNLTRLTDSIKATEIKLTREEWYGLYMAAGNKLP